MDVIQKANVLVHGFSIDSQDYEIACMTESLQIVDPDVNCA